MLWIKIPVNTSAENKVLYGHPHNNNNNINNIDSYIAHFYPKMFRFPSPDRPIFLEK